MGTRITANSDTFQALVSPNLLPSMLVFFLLNHIHSDEKFTIGRYTFTVSLGKKKRKKNENEIYITHNISNRAT